MAEDNPQPDERPRPKYGELAPPGWVWQPPADHDRLDTTRPNPREEEETEPDGVGAPHPYDAPHAPRPYDTPRAYDANGTPPGPAGAPGASASGPVPAPRWDRTLTVLLIAFGFFGMAYSVTTLQALTAYMSMLHSSYGLGDYTPTPIAGTMVTVGTVTMIGLWAISTGLSVWQLVRRRMAFYIPLVAGIVALVALFVFVAVVLSADTVLFDYLSGVMPASPAPTAPATP